MDFFDRFRDYFQRIANSLQEGKYGTDIFPNASDKGATREDVLEEFFKRHLPIRAAVIKGGFIFDSNGNESEQMDLIIINDLTLQFKQFDGEKSSKSFNLVEGCYAAISVKSNLNKRDIFDSLDKLASIPVMPDMSKRINPSLKLGEMDVSNLPYKIVFGFEGLSLKKTLDHVNNYYLIKDIPESRKADIIVSNNNFVIIRIGEKEAKTRGGTVIPPNSFYGFGGTFIGAYSLLYILTKIQEYSNIGGSLIMDFKSIFDNTPFRNG